MLFTEWLNLKESHLYPSVTVQMDKMGSLHLWMGEVEPQQVGKYLYKANGKEADLYIQEGKQDINDFINYLTSDEKQDLLNGYPVVTNNIPDDYFSTNEGKKSKKWIQKTHMKTGAFKDYCGGKVTAACIEKGLKSDDPTTVRRASLAKTLRKIVKD